MQLTREWQEQFERKIQERDTKQREKHEGILKEAKEQLDKFYAEYSENKKKATKKEAEPKSGNVWERIYKNIEKEKSDLTRFKQVLNSLRNDKNAPGLTTQ
jgi:predicted aminopeptidase